jgi:glyoxylase-like metal-dependent hydrolase (beta-lactamase superfamily II)
MTIHPIPTGRIDGRSYLLIDSCAAAVVDPDINLSAIEEVLQAEDAVLRYILLTHCHFDHTGGAAALRQRTGAQLCIHELDAPGLNDAAVNMSAAFHLPPVTGIVVDRTLREGDTLTLGSVTVTVLHTPGHTVGGCCYAVPGNLFTGDTLFRGTYGTTECAGGDIDALTQSVERLYALDAELVIWPGHGPGSTIGDERRLDRIHR